MVARRMGSQVGGSSSSGVGGTQEQARIQTEDPKSNQLTREGSLYNLTLDEVQNQLGDLGKPLSSMNLDELLKTVWTVEANNHTLGGVDYGTSLPQPGDPALGLPLNRQSSLTLSRALSKKTVDEVWQHIQQEQRSGTLDRKGTLGEMTLEDFLVKAGVVGVSPSGNKNLGSVMGVVDPMEFSQQDHWMNFSTPALNPQQQQQHNMLPAYMPSHPVQQPVTLGGNPVMDASYAETQIAMSSSPLMGNLSDTHTPSRKRVPPHDVAERSVERRQKRMIKNRESAARSRARKQAYTHELENKISRLEEENERLKRLQEWEKALPSISPPEPKYQLRRTSSASI